MFDSTSIPSTHSTHSHSLFPSPPLFLLFLPFVIPSTLHPSSSPFFFLLVLCYFSGSLFFSLNQPTHQLSLQPLLHPWCPCKVIDYAFPVRLVSKSNLQLNSTLHSLECVCVCVHRSNWATARSFRGKSNRDGQAGNIIFWAKHQNKLFCLGSPPPATFTEGRSTTHIDPHTFCSFSFYPPCHQLCSSILSHRPKHKVAQTTTHRRTLPTRSRTEYPLPRLLYTRLHPLRRLVLPPSSLYFPYTIHGQQHHGKSSRPGQQRPHTKHV